MLVCLLPRPLVFQELTLHLFLQQHHLGPPLQFRGPFRGRRWILTIILSWGMILTVSLARTSGSNSPQRHVESRVGQMMKSLNCILMLQF